MSTLRILAPGHLRLDEGRAWRRLERRQRRRRPRLPDLPTGLNLRRRYFGPLLLHRGRAKAKLSRGRGFEFLSLFLLSIIVECSLMLSQGQFNCLGLNLILDATFTVDPVELLKFLPLSLVVCDA